MTWLVPLLGILIKFHPLDQSFKQVRSGLDNKEFTCLKFRTMELNDVSDIKQAIKNDLEQR